MPDKLVHHFAAPSYSVNTVTDLSYHLPLRFQQEPIFSMIHRFPWQMLKLFFHLKVSNILFCPLHISGSQQEAQIADHNSLVITSATFPRNCQKSRLWFTKHFLSSIIHAFQSCAVATPRCETVTTAKSLVYLHLGQICFCYCSAITHYRKWCTQREEAGTV